MSVEGRPSETAAGIDVGHEVMASLGSYLLLTAFVISAYAPAISVADARRRSRRLIESGIGAFYLTAAVMAAASAVMIFSFVTNDYTIKYVQHYSHSVQPLFYTHTASC